MGNVTTEMLALAVKHAEELANSSGMNAAAWLFSSETTAETYRYVLNGIDDGDPAVLDTLPGPEDFLGPILRASAEAAGIDQADMTEDAEREILDAYDFTFRTAVEHEVANLATYHLMGGEES